MRIGVPKEVKNHEYRVALTPSGAVALVNAGHEVLVEKDAGLRIGLTDADYIKAGAKIVADAASVYAADMVVKVKEPQAQEWPYLREGLVLFSYLHMAAEPELTRHLVDGKVIGIAYEGVTDKRGLYPLLIPMSEIAGRLAVQAGAWALQMANGGNGVLLAGVPGVAPGKVLIIGGGTVGTNATKIAIGMGSEVTLLDRDAFRLRQFDDAYGNRIKTRYSTAQTLEELLPATDLLVGAVLLPGRRAPKLLNRKMIRSMKPGAVLVDVAIDQGGCAETSRPTTHSDPIYIEEGVVHYCVTNMPAATARTATEALCAATLPYILELANLGHEKALQLDAGLRNGVNVYLGEITHSGIAEDLGYTFHALNI